MQKNYANKLKLIMHGFNPQSKYIYTYKWISLCQQTKIIKIYKASNRLFNSICENDQKIHFRIW